MRSRSPALPLCSLIVLSLAGCGGGGGGGSEAPVAAQAPAAVTLSGVVAKGAPFTEGVVTVTDGTGAVVGTSAAVGADGSYTVTLASGAKAPFVLSATRTGLNGQTETLVSVASSAVSGTVNVTPVTTLIAALLSPSGDPGKLAAEVASGAARVTGDTVTSRLTQVQAMLAPLAEATQTTGTNPLSGTFSTNGTGYDRLLDSINVNITPASANTSNIEIALKQQGSEGVQPISLSFTSDAPAAASVTLPPVDPATLVDGGLSPRITRFLADLTRCYALPLTERVQGATDASTAVTGGAGDVKAPECRSLFVGADPSAYLSNGVRVGRDANNSGAFSGLFRKGANGVVFSQGAYEFTRGNGDVVISYKSRDAAGNEAFDSLVVRKDGSDGKLKLIGNQYVYPGSVVPYQQVRQFFTLDQSRYGYRSSGYVVNVDNQTDAQGNPVFDRVEVVPPRGGVMVLKPARGYSYLALVKNGNTTGTNFVRLRSDFIDPATQGDIPAMEPGLFFVGTPMSEVELAAVPSQAAFTYRYFLAGNTGNTPDAEQTYRTRARALTLGELAQKKLSTLSDAVLTELRGRAIVGSGSIPLPTNGPADLGDPAQGGGWTVAASAMPATSLTIFGSYRGSGFNDSANFGSTARTASVPCSAATAADLHCSTSAGGAFASGAVATGLHLWARDSAGREYANFYAAYKLTLP